MAKSEKTRPYQKMADELSVLVEWFESDQVDLDQAVDKYQQAMELLKEMEDYLKTAENKVLKIKADFGEV